MKPTIICALLLSTALTGFSQYKWEMGTAAGVSNYLGEIGGNENARRDFILDMKPSKTRSSLGYFARYKLKHNFFLKGGLSWNRISGDDKLSSNPGRRGRNLSFRNNIVETAVTAQYVFYEKYHIGRHYQVNNNFMAYVFTGIAGFYHNPEAEYYGEWVSLEQLKTEGQSKQYGLIQAAIPAGTGFFFTMNKKYRIGWELNWRTTFTDYLDDVSSVYPAASSLESSLSADLSNRNDELGNYNPNTDGIAYSGNYTPGSKRGDPTHNDSYLTTSVNVSYMLQGQSDYGKKRKGEFGKRIYRYKIIRARV